MVRVKNGVEIGPGDLVAPVSPVPELVRLLGPDGTLVALAKPAENAGFLHASIVF